MIKLGTIILSLATIFKCSQINSMANNNSNSHPQNKKPVIPTVPNITSNKPSFNRSQVININSKNIRLHSQLKEKINKALNIANKPEHLRTLKEKLNNLLEIFKDDIESKIWLENALKIVERLKELAPRDLEAQEINIINLTGIPFHEYIKEILDV